MEEILDARAETGERSAFDQERAWIEASQKGDPQAFNRLVLKWEQAVFNIALRLLDDRDEASEVSQEVFLSAYRHIRKFRGDAQFSTWLYRIAVNRSFSRLRRRPAAVYSIDSEKNAHLVRELRTGQCQERNLLREERSGIVRRALSALPAEQKVVLELKFFREQTFEEIAAVLDLPASTIKSRFYAALDVLKRRLTPALED